MDKSIKIVFLYAELISYMEGTILSIKKLYPQAIIDVVHWDTQKISSYQIENHQEINLHKRSLFNRLSINEFLNLKNPDIIYISGWMDKDYFHALRKYKNTNKDVLTVCGIDDQWFGTLRQFFGKLLFAIYLKRIFDFLWVSGLPQYHYARKMGYASEKIILNLYSANSAYFRQKSNFSNRIVFLGRFAPVKGIANLIKVYKMLPLDTQKKFPLVLIGDGSEKANIIKQQSETITIKPYLQGSELQEELLKGGIFCAPSLKEPWGVVIHEMASMGYPLILSNVCGAATEFLINGYNGFSFDVKSNDSFLNALTKITSLSHESLELFGERSHKLGYRIDSDTSAASLLSILS